MPSPSLPAPPKPLILALAGITLFCFAAGFVLSHSRGSILFSLGRNNVGNEATASRLVNVELLVPSQEGASRLKEEYKKQGYRLTLNPMRSEVQVQSGFVVSDLMAPLAAKSATEVLTSVYHFSVSSKKQSKDKIWVQVGSVYTKKA